MSRRHCAGRLRFFKHEWSCLTTDTSVLETISGYKIVFESKPIQISRPPQLPLSLEEKVAIEKEISSLLEKGAIRRIQVQEVEYLSTIFTIPKKSGDLRPIINLKNLNRFVKYEHFKMETFKDVKDMLMKSDYLTSIDLKDAYFSVPIHENYHKYLCFQWEDNYYCFQCLPFGLSSAPRVFTKVMKPVSAYLRSLGMRIMVYLDDILILGRSFDESVQNTRRVIDLLQSLGFVINFDKSSLSPKNSLIYLGFEIDSSSMLASLPVNKILKLQSFGREIISSSSISIRTLSQFIGYITSSFDVFPKGRLHFRELEQLKDGALHESCNNFDAIIPVGRKIRSEIGWWLSLQAEEFRSPVEIPEVSITIRTDASNSGWGAVCENDNSFSQGLWSEEELSYHINKLELLAVQRGLISLLGESINNIHVHVESDNITTVTYVRKMGGKVPALNNIANDIWCWAIDRNIWLSASHLAGHSNTKADNLSRRDMNKELSLCSHLFNELLSCVPFTPELDLFASHFNNKLPTFVSWKFHPLALATDAFSISWGEITPYLFPPFCLLSRVLHKFRIDRCPKAILLAPLWRAQPWFPLILRLAIAPPILLPKDALIPLPIPLPEIKLLAWIISTDDGAQLDFRKTLPVSSKAHGATVQINNMNPPGKCGWVGAIDDRSIHWVLL